MMRSYLRPALASALILGGLVASLALPAAPRPAQAQGQGRWSVVPGQYVVVLKEGVDSGEAAGALSRRHGLALGHVYGTALRGFSAAIPEGRVEAVAGDPRVAAVYPDILISLDPRELARGGNGGGGGKGGSQPPQVVPSGVQRIGGPESSTVAGNGSGSVSVDIAIIDTGIDTRHPDLNVAGGVNFSSGKPNSYKDGNGHGTHVAGTAAALDNSIGVVGVAPGARLWAVRVVDNAGLGTISQAIAGVNWVAQNAGTIEVANMSLGYPPYAPLDSAVESAIAAGVVFAVAAGNESADASTLSPARTPGALTTSALDDATNAFAWFSNYGTLIDLIAPGVSILSTYKGGAYAYASGTSMASPHVAGAAALYRSLNPSATPGDVRNALIAAGEDAPVGGWSGDPDGISERLVKVDSF